MKSKMQKFTLKKNGQIKNKNTASFKKIQAKRKRKKETDDEEINVLSKRLWPGFGENKEEIKPSDLKTFSDLPISKKTSKGLQVNNFHTPTDIQRESLMFGLQGRDILGAAKTGSGKTLAFIIPILETLFRQRYTPSFGMAALVISPTRELAFQTFEVLRKVGKFHDFSAGLVTGGLDLKKEAAQINTTNIIVATPGRLQQHLDQTANFTADEVKILVLDEADKILHMGFAQTLNAIIEALPRQRQTLLFSATQTKSVKDLVRLSLKKPVYVSAHEAAPESTPTQLQQAYIVCPMQDKINTLWSFIQTHKHTKMLVFMSCCKQVRFVYQSLRKMSPGMSVFCLHGHMKQKQRMESFHYFTRKQHAVLLATDVAARGLDFPVVNWVLQLDKPENADTYIHRVGRTARYEKVGQALMVLLPSEETKMVEDLKKRKIPIKRLKVRKSQFFDVTKKLQSLCASSVEMKDNSQKAVISTLKTYHVLDKQAFASIDLEAFAASYGLVQAPKLPFLEKSKVKLKEKKSVETEESSSEESDGSDGDDEESEDESSSESEAGDEPEVLDKTKETLDFGVHDDDNEEKEIYKVVRDDKTGEKSDKTLLHVVETSQKSKKKSTARENLKLLKQASRITFDEEGLPERLSEEEDEDQGGLDISQAQKRMREEDKVDKAEYRRRVKEQHREKRLKEKEKRRQAELEKRQKNYDNDDVEVVLGNPDGDTHLEEGDNDAENNEISSDEDDESPKAKRLKLNDSSEEESDENDNDMSDNDEESDDDDEEDEENSDSDSEVDDNAIRQDESAALALLNK